METYESFTSWAQLLDHISAGYPLLYLPPEKDRPSQVDALVRRDGKLRVTFIYGGGEPFIAGETRLYRFRRYVERVNK